MEEIPEPEKQYDDISVIPSPNSTCVNFSVSANAFDPTLVQHSGIPVTAKRLSQHAKAAPPLQ